MVAVAALQQSVELLIPNKSKGRATQSVKRFSEKNKSARKLRVGKSAAHCDGFQPTSALP
jgi:hypothetical protein